MMESSNTTGKPGDVVTRFYRALEEKDLAGARACCSPTAIFWHNFDGVEQTLEEASKGWRGLFEMFSENATADVRRQVVNDGVVQRHLFLMRGKDGVLKGKPCCVFVRIENGLIARLDEYIDLSNSLPVADDARVTAGLRPGTALV